MHQHLQRGFFVVRRFRQSHNKKQPGPLLHHVPPLWHAVLLRWAGGVTVNLRSLRDASLATLHQRQHHQWSKKKAESYQELEDKWLGSADLGFDPLNLSISEGFFDKANASQQAVYYNYRESEVKHGRFAMVGFLAIFCEGADRDAVLNQIGVVSAQDNLDATLGLDEVQGPVLLLGLATQALAEYSKQRKEDDDDFTSVEYQ